MDALLALAIEADRKKPLPAPPDYSPIENAIAQLECCMMEHIAELGNKMGASIDDSHASINESLTTFSKTYDKSLKAIRKELKALQESPKPSYTMDIERDDKGLIQQIYVNPVYGND
jgi:hypothetical protein